MTGPGRPSTGTPIHIRIPADDLAAIDRDAEVIGSTRVALIRQIIHEHARDVPDWDKVEADRRTTKDPRP